MLVKTSNAGMEHTDFFLSLSLSRLHYLPTELFITMLAYVLRIVA